ncbi:ATP-binding cassette domain-containing protein [Patulibacter sp. NPDC049589]|uniref:ABC transporter ATP-binding protein n=1 Tax=Patulibacter sp. NPDC049589 TaxID=3154731 RepID=UPI00343C218B
MLELDHVTLVHNPGTITEVTALRDLSLRVPRGQMVTIVGTNGAGKSSLVRSVAGEERPSRGRVLFDGDDVTRTPDHRRAGRVARVFDDPHAGTLPELSIEDNLALALARGRRRRLRFALTAARRAEMRERLAVLGLGLEDRLGDPVSLLSAGQRQSLTLVMAGLRDPEVLLLDEHLAALDPGTQRTVLGLTVDLVERVGCTAIMVTHNMEHALELGDRLLVMSRGRIITDVSGAEKRAMTVPALIDRITGAGDVVSDRSVLGDGPARPVRVPAGVAGGPPPAADGPREAAA